MQCYIVTCWYRYEIGKAVCRILYQLCEDLHRVNFGEEKVAIEVTVKMIYDGKKDDNVNQETIRICKDKNILREYLENKESEVVYIMMQLYDQEEIMRVHIQSERRNSGIMNVVIALREVGFPFSEIVNKIAKQLIYQKKQQRMKKKNTGMSN